MVRVGVGIGPETIITVKRRGKLIHSEKFQVESLKGVIATLGGNMDSIQSKKAILLNPFLVALIPNSYWDCKFFIASFNAVLPSSSEGEIETHSTSNMLTNEQINYIKNMNAGDTILFKDIRLMCSSCRTTTLRPFKIKIKD